MEMQRSRFLCTLLIILALPAIGMQSPENRKPFPEFGQDTVLVWKIQNIDYDASFVVRIAEFFPDRFVEWEDEQTQGTIFMPNQAILAARGFVNSALFKSGGDTRGKGVTTLWLSQQIYRELKEKRKAKCMMDGVSDSLKYSGDDQLSVEVNRSAMMLPVIKVIDNGGSERWFLDREDNPLMLSHRLRKFSQTLTSITTDKANTLRWIKGKKLANPPH